MSATQEQQQQNQQNIEPVQVQQQQTEKLQNYKQLKEENFPLVNKRRGTDTDLKVSDADIQQIENARINIGKIPLITGLTTFLVAKSISYLTKPGILQNPISPDERTIVRRKFFKHFISNQMIFFGFMGGFIYGFAKFELTKYYIYLKHRRLVNCYLDAVEMKYLDNLEGLGDKAELLVRQNLNKPV